MPFPKDTNITFINKAMKPWGERYDYPLVQYLNSRTPVVIICKRHLLEFEQTPKAHFAARHHCCPLCYQEVAGSYQNEWRSRIPPPSIELNVGKFASIIERIFRDT